MWIVKLPVQHSKFTLYNIQSMTYSVHFKVLSLHGKDCVWHCTVDRDNFVPSTIARPEPLAFWICVPTGFQNTLIFTISLKKPVVKGLTNTVGIAMKETSKQKIKK